MSPSSKLRSVSLLPDVWGKMVLTRCFLATLRPDDWDTDRCRLSSPRLPWSGGSTGSQSHIRDVDICQRLKLKIIYFILSYFCGRVGACVCFYLSCGLRRWAKIWDLGWTYWGADLSEPSAVVLEEEPLTPHCSEEKAKNRMYDKKVH